eukprot:4052064-Ditylum_brightwellii.AAC.1
MPVSFSRHPKKGPPHIKVAHSHKSGHRSEKRPPTMRECFNRVEPIRQACRPSSQLGHARLVNLA